MKFVVGLIILISSMAHAACPALARKALGAGKTTFEVNEISYRSFYSLLQDYKSRFEPSFKPYIESVTGRYRAGALTGFDVKITDGGDESTVRYVTDKIRRPIVAYWYNQSPMTYWFCGTFDNVEEAETADGSEIMP
ncbi:MAG: hypothetical protein K2P81_08130 [Bacteriovoracaceae bacterium]|nr:hypothetical protein [Bacteriovoracaceae bacterium]